MINGWETSQPPSTPKPHKQKPFYPLEVALQAQKLSPIWQAIQIAVQPLSTLPSVLLGNMALMGLLLGNMALMGLTLIGNFQILHKTCQTSHCSLKSGVNIKVRVLSHIDQVFLGCTIYKPWVILIS